MSQSGDIQFEIPTFIRRHIKVEITVLIYVYSLTGITFGPDEIFVRVEIMDTHSWSKIGFRNKEFCISKFTFSTDEFKNWTILWSKSLTMLEK